LLLQTELYFFHPIGVLLFGNAHVIFICCASQKNFSHSCERKRTRNAAYA